MDLKPHSPTPLASLGLVAAAQAQTTIGVNADIATSTTWTANNIYNLASQIYVLPGATLTIEPGTVIASTTTPRSSGVRITRPAACTTRARPGTW